MTKMNKIEYHVLILVSGAIFLGIINLLFNLVGGIVAVIFTGVFVIVMMFGVYVYMDDKWK
jgi:hypothetical protein